MHSESVKLEFARSIAFSIIIALLLRASVVEANKIPSGSMIPTLLVGDYILVNKLAYNIKFPFTKYSLLQYRLPTRGDVVTFYRPRDEERIFIKRVVGLPGDVLEVKGSKLFINGETIPVQQDNISADFQNTFLGHTVYKEQFAKGPHNILINDEAPSPTSYFGPITVPEGNIFVMGDNRDHSSDSRAWGFVPRENVLGTPIAIYFSWNDRLSLFNGAIRWNRIGKPMINI